MIRTITGVLLFSMLAVTAVSAGDIDVVRAWSRATPAGAKVASGYLTIENSGAFFDRLLSASSKIAEKVEIHHMALQDGVMTMRPVEAGLAIAPGDILTLEPGGNHLMFIGLREPLKEGDRIGVALQFERAGTIDVAFDVEGVGAKGPRLLVANIGDQAAAATPAPADGFFTHICGTRVMANVTVSPRRAGLVDVDVQLEDGDEKPLVARSLSLTLTAPDGTPVTMAADRIGADRWHVRMPAAASGKWSVALGIAITANDRVDIDAPVLIE